MTSLHLEQLRPQPNDLVVVPIDMVLPEEDLGFAVYRMKFLHQPSIIRSGNYNMEFLNNFKLSSLKDWLGTKPVASTVLEALDDARFGRLRDSQMPAVATTIRDVAEVVEPKSVTVTFPRDVAKTDLPKFWRYVRPKQIVKKMSGTFDNGVGPKGGATVYVELNAPENTFAFSFALCHESENFNYSIGRQVSKGRFQDEDWYEVANYDQNIGVIENIRAAIDNLFNSPDNTNQQGIMFSSLSPKFKELEMKELFERIKK